ncbi:thioesterase superfamily protein [Hirsutella rhossiliensis]|uniref:Thioesterase superfamily domain-containing protein n=1 Tax=Hirsutella rhossiliensis TaxID=111463 RepID=A0A9P8MUU2_9HYPO|nr:thioesterase superfamily domain-containing protein [Hirsutella rhossiliensis]KAH0961539.1 thioesterase superfamily domain-containing protein [Hirsutella rhossiliensis]
MITRTTTQGIKQWAPDRFIHAVLRSFQAESGLEPSLFGPRFRVTAVQIGMVKFELDIEKDHTNRFRTLHGGTLASLVDFGGSLAIASTGRFHTGVSTDLNISYLAPGGMPGDVIKGSAICDRIGRKLAYTTVTFVDKYGDIAARGSHTKYLPTTMTRDDAFMPPEEFAEDDSDPAMSPHTLSNPYPAEHEKGPKQW